MGLLDRVQNLDDVPIPSVTGSAPIDADELIARLRNHQHRADYPAEVFAAYKAILGFSKGALLLPDENTGEFSPWITEGLDRTTVRRLRIPRGDALLARNSAPPFSGLPPGLLTGILSNREFGLLKNPVILTLGSPPEPTAVMLVTRMENPAFRSDGRVRALEKLNAELSSGITRSREVMAVPETESGLNPEDWLDTWCTDGSAVVLLNTSDAIDAVVDGMKGLEVYRARKDVAGLIRSITGRMGRVFDLKDGRLLIIFPRERMPDSELFLFQLAEAFQSAYETLNARPDFPAESFQWPKDRESVLKNLPKIR